jgi:hypothetical protein
VQDGIVSPEDSLAIINYINAFGGGAVPASATSGGPYYDVTGDGNIAPDDTLAVINYINAQSGPSGDDFSVGSSGGDSGGNLVATEDHAIVGNRSVISNLAANGNPPVTDQPSDLVSLLAFDLVELAMRRRRMS